MHRDRRGRGIRLAALMLGIAGTPSQSGSEAQTVVAAPLEKGVLPPSWVVLQSECKAAPAFRVHRYNPTFFILRQSGCTHYEKPFLYVLVGTSEVLLVDTGAPGANLSQAIDELLQGKLEGRPLLVVHSHGHGDHTAGDAALRARPATRVIDATATAVAQFFGIQNWPIGTAEYDLGGRIVDIVAIPGHDSAHIAVYDRRTGILLTGDTLYAGRLYIRNHAAFRDSIERLVDFTRSRPIAHVFGGHIENTRTPFLDYPVGTMFQPEEHVLELGRAHLLELQDALHQMSTLERRALRDFTVWPF